MMSDTFRKEYKLLDEVGKANIIVIKEFATKLEEILNAISVNNSCDNRCMELAKVNLEQAVMWAVKAIT